MFKILVVEDNKDLNHSVCSFLNQSGYDATGCLNAGEAYDAMYEAIFDLIISDNNAQEPYAFYQLLHDKTIRDPEKMIWKGSQAANRNLNDTFICLFHFAPPYGRKKAPNYLLDSWTLLYN